METFKTESFGDFKKRAYDAAKKGMVQNFSEEWKEKYLNFYKPSPLLKLFEETCRMYGDYLNGKISKEKGQRETKRIEEEYEDIDIYMDMASVVKMMSAVNQAFKDKGIEYGEITINCPNCNGPFTARRLNTPQFTHKMTIRGGCQSCGTHYMN